MDDLDRLAFRLARTIRQQYPQLQERGFTLADLEERLLLHREARREMADGGAAAWERTVLRLLSGERRYVHAPPEVQHASRQALDSPSPTLALVRQFSSASLWVGEALSTVGSERTSSSVEDASLSSSLSSPEKSQIGSHLSAGVRVPVEAASTLRADASGERAPRRTTPCCRFCGGHLPDARRVTFCPHCGIDQTKRQCPACSTELDASWRFCVTCGRSADLPESPAILKRATG